MVATPWGGLINVVLTRDNRASRMRVHHRCGGQRPLIKEPLEKSHTPPQDGDKNPFEDRYPKRWAPLS